MCFTSHIDDEKLMELATNRSLAPRIASFCEVNLDFFMFNETVFTLDMKNQYPLFKILDDEPSFLASQQMTKIL